MAKNETSLEARFKRFLITLDGTEDIDGRLSEQELKGGQRADYLLNDRAIVLELKSLEVDPAEKLQRKISEYESRSEFPVFYWESDLKEILRNFPDKERIKQKIDTAVLRSVQGVFEKADDQVDATKSALAIEQACGVLAILNESAKTLSPDLITAKASQMLLKKDSDGNIRYRNIAYVLVISETHRVTGSNPRESLPIITLEGPTADEFISVDSFLSSLLEKWARFEGHQYVSMGERENFDGMHFQERSEEKSPEEGKQLTRQEYWRKSYQRYPYLRQLSEQEFLERTAKIMNAMKPHFIIGGRKLPFHEISQLMQQWTHCLEEAEFRRMDMKKLSRFL
ncbi:hypothetical protein [Salinisphaera orenii]|uniref:hypothetical protein n=1 Tax=Salinisphaera orenii TaxID=856731 RepID=UPI000F4BAF91|nr:hypothetical protein [Salinisphaera orenii]